MTECFSTQLEFQGFPSRRVVADFDGGRVSSDAGVLLLREADLSLDLSRRFAQCFTDNRDQDRIAHSLEGLVRQRLFALCMGYEDVSDHEALRNDPIFRVLCGQGDVEQPLAGKSTLNRVEVSASSQSNPRYHQFGFSPDAFHSLLVELFLESFKHPPAQIVIDMDATDVITHGNQEDIFFHGYYRNYCYLPLDITCGDHILHAQLRPSNIDAAKGSVEALAPIIAEIRKRWPKTRVIVRGDGGFCREDLMEWCEQRAIAYIFGLAKNTRLLEKCAKRMEKARRKHLRTGEPQRMFQSFSYRTKDSWSCSRRVVAKCEHLAKGANPRFVVTNLLSCEIRSQELYETLYCQRGEMENRIKDQMDMFADTMSCSAFNSNQLRLAFSTMAYTVMSRLRLALKQTSLKRARPSTIRTRLLKIGARIKVSVRRVVISMASGFPLQEVFAHCLRHLRANAPPPSPKSL